jgi:hypothetical protein
MKITLKELVTYVVIYIHKIVKLGDRDSRHGAVDSRPKTTTGILRVARNDALW